jgi:hypothetical protein
MGVQAMQNGEPHHARERHQDGKKSKEQRHLVSGQTPWYEKQKYEQRKQEHEHGKSNGGRNGHSESSPLVIVIGSNANEAAGSSDPSEFTIRSSRRN